MVVRGAVSTCREEQLTYSEDDLFVLTDGDANINAGLGKYDEDLLYQSELADAIKRVRKTNPYGTIHIWVVVPCEDLEKELVT